MWRTWCASHHFPQLKHSQNTLFRFSDEGTWGRGNACIFGNALGERECVCVCKIAPARVSRRRGKFVKEFPPNDRLAYLGLFIEHHTPYWRKYYPNYGHIDHNNEPIVANVPYQLMNTEEHALQVPESRVVVKQRRFPWLGWVHNAMTSYENGVYIYLCRMCDCVWQLYMTTVAEQHVL